MSAPEVLALPAWQRVAAVEDFGPGLVMSVGGEPVWWASRDVDLCASPEAAICLLAPWCALEGRALQLSAPVPDSAFLDNVRAATTLMGSWWGHDPIRFLLPPGTGGRVVPARRSPASTALFFSGGIDSFYSLVRIPDLGVLVFIIGFDVRLHKRATWEAMLSSYRELAAEQGLQFIAIATNLRDHPVLGKMRWGRYHGMLLAAATHLLRERASRWIISSSFQQDNLMPWGSHPDLDGLWSGGGVEIIHYGAEMWLDEKLRALAGFPMVHRRLRVCYADPQADGNCGRCEKCVRTRLIYWLDLPGVLCNPMPADLPLAAALDGVPRVELRVIANLYRRLVERSPPADPVTIAVRALIRRSEGGNRP